jgi:hypothetical protein
MSVKEIPNWLWSIVSEFDQWTKSHRDLVTRHIEEVVFPRVKRFQDAQAGLPEISAIDISRDLIHRAPPKKPPNTATSEEMAKYTKECDQHNADVAEYMDVARDEAFDDASIVRAKMAAEDSVPDIAKKLATLAGLHDRMLEIMPDRATRLEWTPVAPSFADKFHGVEWEINFKPTIKEIDGFIEDHDQTGRSHIADYWCDVQQHFGIKQIEGSSEPLTMTEQLLLKIAMACSGLDEKIKKRTKTPSHWNVFLAVWKDRLSQNEMARKFKCPPTTAGFRLRNVEKNILGGSKVSALCFDGGILDNVNAQLESARKHGRKAHHADLLDNTTGSDTEDD